MESPCSKSQLCLQPWASLLQKYQITVDLSTLDSLCQLSQGQASRALSVCTIQLSLNHTLPQRAYCFTGLSSALPTQTQVPYGLKLSLRFPSSKLYLHQQETHYVSPPFHSAHSACAQEWLISVLIFCPALVKTLVSPQTTATQGDPHERVMSYHLACHLSSKNNMVPR